jgi:hypothetical protein
MRLPSMTWPPQSCHQPVCAARRIGGIGLSSVGDNRRKTSFEEEAEALRGGQPNRRKARHGEAGRRIIPNERWFVRCLAKPSRAYKLGVQPTIRCHTAYRAK